MKPSLLNLLFTHHLAMCVTVGALAGIGMVFVELQQLNVLIWGWSVIFWLTIALVPAALIGAIVSCIFLGPVIAHIGLRIQGGPFVVGDRVSVLTGEHQGMVAYVYAVWAERFQVRLDLSEEANEKLSDVKSMLEVCRISTTQEPREGK